MNSSANQKPVLQRTPETNDSSRISTLDKQNSLHRQAWIFQDSVTFGGSMWHYTLYAKKRIQGVNYIQGVNITIETILYTNILSL